MVLILALEVGVMRENERRRRHQTYHLLFVSLLSSLHCEVVSAFLSLLLALFCCFWTWLALQSALTHLIAISNSTPRTFNRHHHNLPPSFFPHCKFAGMHLLEKHKDLMSPMAPDSLNTRFWYESLLCRLSRLAFMASCNGSSSGGGMSSSNKEFMFRTGKRSATVGKILLVEDTEINRKLLRKLVGDLNLLLEEAENGQIAVDYFKQGKNYDLVLMDKEMPVMDGHEATRQLRSLGVKTPIIALTGNSLQSDKDMFFQAGANEFRTKPISRDELVRLLARYGLDNPAPAPL